MATFLGQFTATIDDKGRVVLPSAFKKVLIELGLDSVVIERNRLTKCLDIHTKNAWQEQVDQFIAKLKLDTNPQHDKIRRLYFKNFAQINIATNGRINIPDAFMKFANLENKVEFLGMKDTIRISAIKEEIEEEMSDEDYRALLNTLEEDDD